MAKDQNDKHTKNLLVSSDAERQQKRRERMRARGFRQKLFWVKLIDFEKGVQDFQTGLPMKHSDLDEFSYSTGYLKAKADSVKDSTSTSTSTSTS